MEYLVDLFRHPGNSFVSFPDKPEKGCPVTDSQNKNQNSRLRADQEHARRPGHDGYEEKQSCKLPDLSISKHRFLPAGIRSPGPSG